MSEAKKLTIGFVVVGLLCCCVAVAAFLGFREFGKRTQSMINGDPTSVAKIQNKIADYEIPQGYKTQAMDMFIYDLISLSPDSSSHNKPTIILMQYNGAISGNSAQVEEQLRQAAEQQGNQAGASMHYVDSFDKEIRGETVTVTVSEGDYGNFTMRQWITIFKGNRGPTILMIQGPAENWDDQLVEDFIKSIK
ncbi:MAG: hypothetical protein U0Z26_11255 [Anaerolineales bacterium]